jgi:hypothetical protein
MLLQLFCMAWHMVLQRLALCVRALSLCRAADQALLVVGQAAGEVRRLQATLYEFDQQMGWQGAAEAQRFDPRDVHSALAWLPAGKQRRSPAAGARPSSGGSPLGSSGSGGGGSPMSRASRRMVQAQGGSFLDRLSRDVEARQAKAAEVAGRAGRYQGGAAEAAAEREREERDLRFIMLAAARAIVLCGLRFVSRSGVLAGVVSSTALVLWTGCRVLLA